jgi:hypothetical protein
MNVPRRCLKCRRLFTGTRCPRPTCSSRDARGYGAAHRAARRALERTLPASCGYCGRVIGTEEHWHAAHILDGDPTKGWIVACPACNEQAKRRHR